MPTRHLKLNMPENELLIFLPSKTCSFCSLLLLKKMASPIFQLPNTKHWHHPWHLFLSVLLHFNLSVNPVDSTFKIYPRFSHFSSPPSTVSLPPWPQLPLLVEPPNWSHCFCPSFTTVCPQHNCWVMLLKAHQVMSPLCSKSSSGFPSHSQKQLEVFLWLPRSALAHHISLSSSSVTLITHSDPATVIFANPWTNKAHSHLKTFVPAIPST